MSAADCLWVNVLARQLGHEPDALRGPRRLSEYVRARAAISRRLRSEGWSYPRIGRALGNRHRTGIMYLCGALPQRLPKTDAAVNP